ncbi:MAG: hypothetical protein V4621_08355, partial [Pseudomonadota bacterium]
MNLGNACSRFGKGVANPLKGGWAGRLCTGLQIRVPAAFSNNQINALRDARFWQYGRTDRERNGIVGNASRLPFDSHTDCEKRYYPTICDVADGKTAEIGTNRFNALRRDGKTERTG